MAAPSTGLAHARQVVGLAARVEQVPLLPSIVTRMLALDPLADRYFDDLVLLARQDPTFALRVIRLANSSASAPTRPIVELTQAVVRLGARQCTNLITAMAVSRVFVPRTPGQRQLWMHSIQVATAARTIASMRAGAPFSPEQAYLAGLLHDVGRFIMFECASEDLDIVDESRWATPDELLRAETDLLGYDHVRLGTLVAKRWSLPQALVDVIEHHHSSAIPGTLHVSTAALIRCVQMADLTSVRVSSYPEWLALDPSDLAVRLARDCVRPEWPSPPLAPGAFAHRVPEVFREAADIAAGLLELGHAARSAP